MIRVLQSASINCSEWMGKEGKVVGGCPLCKNKQTNKNNRIDCTELSLKNSHTQIENLWVKFGYQDNKENFLVGIYHTLPDQEKDVDEEFFLQPQEASCSPTLILLQDFNLPGICWKSGAQS